jgi:hypothetical protein
MRAFPFATTISVLIGLGGLGAQQLLTGAEWAWMWPYVMWGGFGFGLLFFVMGVILHFIGRKKSHGSTPALSDKSVTAGHAAGPAASGDRSAAVGGDNNGLLVTGTMYVQAPLSVSAPPTPQPSPRPDLTLSDFVDQRITEISNDDEIDGHLEAVGSLFAHIRQAATLAQIRVWGRRNCPMGQRGIPLTEIKPTYWERHQIDMLDFLSDPERRLGKTEVAQIGGEQVFYTDIRLDHDEASRFLPVEKG